MKAYVVAALVSLVGTSACQSDQKQLNDRMERIEKKLDALIATGGARGAAPGAAQPRPQRPEPDRGKTYSIAIDNDAFDGPADAKVTVVKAYDYACPYCERVRPTMEELHKKYGKDLRVVYKQLVVHPTTAMAPALAFCAAGRQGKHKEIDALIWDKMFKERKYPPDKCWEQEAGCELMNQFATELKLDLPKFKADMKACQSVVQTDMRDLQKFGVGATPSFFINGRFMSGAMPIDNFVALIDEEMKKANERIQQGTPAGQYYQQWVVDKGLKSLEAPKQ
jgi:protein-disulfide isomerase